MWELIELLAKIVFYVLSSVKIIRDIMTDIKNKKGNPSSHDEKP